MPKIHFQFSRHAAKFFTIRRCADNNKNAKTTNLVNPGDSRDSRNKTRPAKVVVVANSKQKVFSRTHNVVKYTPKNFGYDYTLY